MLHKIFYKKLILFQYIILKAFKKISFIKYSFKIEILKQVLNKNIIFETKYNILSVFF